MKRIIAIMMLAAMAMGAKAQTLKLSSFVKLVSTDTGCYMVVVRNVGGVYTDVLIPVTLLVAKGDSAHYVTPSQLSAAVAMALHSGDSGVYVTPAHLNGAIAAAQVNDLKVAGNNAGTAQLKWGNLDTGSVVMVVNGVPRDSSNRTGPRYLIGDTTSTSTGELVLKILNNRYGLRQTGYLGLGVGLSTLASQNIPFITFSGLSQIDGYGFNHWNKIRWINTGNSSPIIFQGANPTTAGGYGFRFTTVAYSDGDYISPTSGKYSFFDVGASQGNIGACVPLGTSYIFGYDCSITLKDTTGSHTGMTGAYTDSGAVIIGTNYAGLYLTKNVGWGVFQRGTAANFWNGASNYWGGTATFNSTIYNNPAATAATTYSPVVFNPSTGAYEKAAQPVQTVISGGTTILLPVGAGKYFKTITIMYPGGPVSFSVGSSGGATDILTSQTAPAGAKTSYGITNPYYMESSGNVYVNNPSGASLTIKYETTL